MIFLTIQFILAAMSVTETIFHHAMRKRANLSIKIQRLPSIKRLPTYLRELKVVRKEGREVISAAAMAERLEMEAIVVRKDLEITGATGYPGIGYDINDLILYLQSGRMPDVETADKDLHEETNYVIKKFRENFSNTIGIIEDTLAITTKNNTVRQTFALFIDKGYSIKYDNKT